VGNLTFSIEHQDQDQWCWAAVTISICRFYKDQRWQHQCNLVNEILSSILGGVDCCEDGASDNCNISFSLSDVLNTTGHLVQLVQGVVSFEDLNQEIEVRQRPLAIRIVFSDFITRHFIVVVGCMQTPDGKQWVKVADPSQSTGNTTSIEYTSLLNDYRPGATWDQSYFSS
jgi:Papain-like cysteine protease AvrRpt2